MKDIKRRAGYLLPIELIAELAELAAALRRQVLSEGRGSREAPSQSQIVEAALRKEMVLRWRKLRGSSAKK